MSERDEDIKADVEKAAVAVANGHKPTWSKPAVDEGTVDPAEYLKHFGIIVGQ
jgi:hypothetical protein